MFAAIKAITADEILFFRTLVWIRRFGRPGPESILNVPKRQPILDVATPATRRRFAAYWRVIYPGSALIRRMWLRAIARRVSQPVQTLRSDNATNTP